jgi:cobalt-zinc-cadmium efflux system outer membrane protein
MRRGTAILCLVLLGWTPVPAVWAQAAAQGAVGELTVDDLVARALADNPDLRAARAGVDAAQGRLRQAGLRPNPMLDLGFQQSVTGPDNNLTVMATLPLDLGGRKAGRVGVAARGLDVQQAQVRERERQLRAEVRLKAGEVLAAQRNLGVTDELLAVNRAALDLVRARVSRGAAPPLEENLLVVEVNRFEASRHLLASQVTVLTLQIKPLAGLGPEVSLSVCGDLRHAPVRLDLQDALTQALAVRADLGAAQAEVAMSEAQIVKERAEGRWDASVNVGYMRQNFGFDLRGLTDSGSTQPITDIFHYVGGGVTVMVPLRHQNQGNIAAAMAETTAAARRLDAVLLTIRQEVTVAFTHYAAAQQALAVYTRGVREVARQNLEVVRKAYELGRSTLLDVIAEQRRYIDIEMGYTDALKQVYDAAMDIERAVGVGAH